MPYTASFAFAPMLVSSPMATPRCWWWSRGVIAEKYNEATFLN